MSIRSDPAKNRIGTDTKQRMMWAFKLRGCEGGCGRRPQTIEELREFHIHHLQPSLKGERNNHSIVNSYGMRNTKSSTVQEFLLELMTCQCLCVQCHHRRKREVWK